MAFVLGVVVTDGCDADALLVTVTTRAARATVHVTLRIREASLGRIGGDAHTYVSHLYEAVVELVEASPGRVEGALPLPNPAAVSAPSRVGAHRVERDVVVKVAVPGAPEWVHSHSLESTRWARQWSCGASSVSSPREVAVRVAPGERAHGDRIATERMPVEALQCAFRQRRPSMKSAQTITLETTNPPRQAVLAIPNGPGPHPGVVVIHDITGFRRDTRRHCERFAAEGYAAIAPDLYGDGNVACVVRTLISTQTGRGGAHAVIAAARRHLAARDDVDEGRLGVIGFCMGGGFALIAAADDHYAVAAPFYGIVPRQAERLRGVCPTLAQYGERDLAFVPHAHRLEQHLTELGVPHEVLIHPGVGHSFMNDHPGAIMRVAPHLPPLHAGYDAATEADAWARLLAFFQQHMGGTPEGRTEGAPREDPR